MFTLSGPIAMHMLVPALPHAARDLGASVGAMQTTISLYILGLAVGQLGYGPVSDRFGRRPILMVGLSLYTVAGLAAFFAPNVLWLIVARVLQALGGGAGMALSRAIVRDMVPPERAASMIGYVTMGMALIPMVVPVLGGVLDELFGWQSVFAFTFVFGLAVTALLWADLGETNRDPSPSMRAQMRSYPELLRSARFWGYAATAALASGTFFAFIGGGPWVATQILGLTPSTFGFYFGFISAGYVVGNFFSGRYAMRVGINLMMLAGGLVGTAGVVLALVLFAAGLVGPLSFFGAILFVGVGNGLLLPSANAGIVSVEPHLAGSASGLGSAMLVGGGAALSVLGGGLLGPGTGAWPLLFVMLATSALGLATTLLVMRADVDGA
jgi:DHA1 family bicyclomycin/chloramphenicol resistance-like MFS transporter